jgi:hypothetical protein
MTLFAIRTRSRNRLDRDVVEKFIDDTAERLKNPNPYTNPLKGSIRKCLAKETFVISMEPLYFNFTPYFWLTTAVGILFWGFTPWLLIPVSLGCLGVFWSKHFFYWVCVRGLRKAGYVGPVMILNNKQIIERLIL